MSALTSVVPAMAGADQRDGLQPSDALAVSPLDEWGMVETTTGRYLIGELIIRNRSRMPRAVIELRLAEQPARLGEQPARLGEQPAPPTVRLTGADLLARMANGSTNLPVASRNLAGGDSVLVFLWEPISAGATIRSVALDVGFEESSSRDQTITIPLTSPLVEPVRVHPPLAGGPWVALYDPHMPRGHRRVAFARGGRQVVPARFAIDWVRLDETGRTTGAGTDDFGRWFGFGVDVLAVADAKVVAVRDSYPDVLTRERPAKWTDDDVSGNYVGIELGPGRFAFYEHLQRGSVRVAVGDSVRAGQPIARLGRSGVNSSGPHLHFHVGTEPSTLDSQGRPWVLSQFALLGGYQTIVTALNGTPWSIESGSTAPRVVSDRLPAPNAVMRFDSL